MKYSFNKQYVVEADSQQEAEHIFEQAKNPNKYYKQITVEELIEKPSIDEIIAHYKTGIADTCLVCGQELSGPYTDLQGQIRCVHCGVSYQIAGCTLKDEFLVANNLDRNQVAQRYCDVFEYVPLLKEYWKEVGLPQSKKVPFGEDSRITQDEIDSFFYWLVKNSRRFKKQYPGFSWDRIELQYEEP